MKAIYDVCMGISNWLWSLPILIVLIGGGIYLTIMCDFVQFKHLGTVFKKTIGDTLTSAKKNGEGISGWQAVTAALSATLGTGNIVGVGTAIAIGGPGAVFWMWVIGMVAMALKYAEATLAVATRVKGDNGRWLGGAVRYLSNIWKPLGITFGVCQLCGYMVAAGIHTGSVVGGAKSLGIPSIVSTITVCIILAVVLFGGLKMLVRITDKLVPIMAGIYILSGTIIILLNINNLIPAFASIFTGAFSGTSATGGFAGAALSVTIKNGCARGVYSSDAGNGSSSMIYAQAEVDDPVHQGFFGVFEVFFDTIIVCSFTALVILVTGVWKTGEPGSVLAINAFATSLGSAGRFIASTGLILFAGSTALAFCTFMGLMIDDMFDNRVLHICAQIVFIALAFVGGTVGVDIMLPWADFGNAFTVLFNTGGMCIMAGTLHKLTRNYFKNGHSSID